MYSDTLSWFGVQDRTGLTFNDIQHQAVSLSELVQSEDNNHSLSVLHIQVQTQFTSPNSADSSWYC